MNRKRRAGRRPATAGRGQGTGGRGTAAGHRPGVASHRSVAAGGTGGGPRQRPTGWYRGQANVPAGLAATAWLVVIGVPLYFIVITSLRQQDDYLSDGPLHLPKRLSLGNYQRLWDSGFGRFQVNSVIVTVATVLLVLAVALPAAYAIVRNTGRVLRAAFAVFLFGVAIPAQAVIVPIYLIITRLDLYDSLTAIILPTAAFSIPISIIVLTSTLRDIPNELYEAMLVDGASKVLVFARLVFPLARSGLITVAIFSGLNAWNGYLFPLVLTQSAERRVTPLGLAMFQSQYGIDIPGLMSAVVVSAMPVLALYLFGRRHLLHGLAAGFGK